MNNKVRGLVEKWQEDAAFFRDKSAKGHRSYQEQEQCRAAERIFTSCADELKQALAAPAEGAEVVSDDVCATFAEKAAQILSDSPFPSSRSLAKARKISDLALQMYAKTEDRAATQEVDRGG